jgi:hypothetical protein
LWEREVRGFPEERAVEVGWVCCHNITLADSDYYSVRRYTARRVWCVGTVYED